MLATFFGISKPRVDVSLIQSTVVIPPCLHDEVPPPSLRGVVTLRLPTRRSAQRLYVVLEGKYHLYADDKYPAEKGTVFRSTVELALGEELEAGNHVFAFAIDVPTTATVHQRCQYGQVLYSVVATLQLAPKTAISSTPEPVFICGVPFREDFPPPFEVVHEFVSPGLGLVRVQLFSPHLAVSSLVHLQISLASPPSPVRVESVRLSLVQSFAIDYADPDRPRKPSPLTLPLLHIDNSVLPPTSSESKSFGAAVEPGETWQGAALFRVGAHGGVSGSTAPGTTSKLLVSHRLKLEVLYKGGPSAKSSKSAVIEIPVHVGDCEAIPASWSLPQYSFEPPKTRVKRTTSQTSTLCLCEYSHAEALEMYGKVINEAGERVIPPGGMDGKDKGRRRRKSPAVSALPSYS